VSAAHERPVHAAASQELSESETVSTDAERVDAARATFTRAFGGAPAVVASAAGRVNLIGEHTDYNGGEVLPIAIGRRTVVALRQRGDAARTWRAVSATESAGGEFDPAMERVGAWWDYVAGVVRMLGEAGVHAPACDVAVWSDVPAGAGLSSSAALEVATAVAVQALVGGALPPERLALLSQRAENVYVGVNSGIMDQFASALGQRREALHVWCDTGRFEHIAMREAVLIFDTAVPRSLRGSAFNERRAECEEALRLLRERHPELPNLAAASPAQVRDADLPDPLSRRALHVTEETRRVGALVDALRAGGAVPGDLLLASHASLRDQYECSSRELDWFVEHAMQHPGVVGARLTGAGWGGCAIAVGAHDALAAAAPRLAAAYEAEFGRRPRAWLTNAEDGARVDQAGPR